LAEVVVAGARWLRPAWRQRRQLGRSAILAIAAARLEIRRQRSGGCGNNGALEVAAWCMLIIILIVTMTMIIDGGGGKGGAEGGLHALLAVDAMDGDDNRNGYCLSKIGVGQGKRREGIERWVCFFHAALFCYCFLAYLFQCRSIDFCHCRCVLLLPSR
jgi:hypothetical protein